MSKHDTLAGASMITQDTVLVQLIRLIEHIPSPPPPPRRRGRPIVYPEKKLFLKALVIMIVRRGYIRWANCWPYWRNLPSRSGKCASLCAREDAFLRDAPSSGGCVLCPRGCRLRSAASDGISGQAAWSVAEFGTRAVALDSTLLCARGGVWHKKDREAGGVVPHTSIRHRGSLD